MLGTLITRRSEATQGSAHPGVSSHQGPHRICFACQRTRRREPVERCGRRGRSRDSSRKAALVPCRANGHRVRTSEEIGCRSSDGADGSPRRCPWKHEARVSQPASGGGVGHRLLSGTDYSSWGTPVASLGAAGAPEIGGQPLPIRRKAQLLGPRPRFVLG